MKVLYFILILSPIILCAAEQTNILIYGQGDTQVSSEIGEYQSITAGKPIHGTITITHDAQNVVDPSSFKLGDIPLKVELIQTMRMSPYDSLEVSLYRFQLEPFKQGIYTLSPIKVTVGSQVYQAPPLVIEVP